MAKMPSLTDTGLWAARDLLEVPVVGMTEAALLSAPGQETGAPAGSKFDQLSQETTMARAYGSSAHLLMKRETTYRQAATGDYIRMPFTRCDLAVLSELLPAVELGLVEAMSGDRARDDRP